MNRRTFIKVGSLWLASAPAIVRAIPPQLVAALQKPQAAPVVSAGGGPPTDYVGYWPLNESSGTNAPDASGNGNAGTLSGSTLPTWVTGKFGNGLDFGAASAYVDLGTSATTMPDVWTLALWVKRVSVTNYSALFGWQSASVNIFPNIWMQFGGSTGPTIYLNANSSRAWNPTTPTDPNDGNWHHLAFTMPGVAKASIGSALLYIDGTVQDVTSTDTSDTPASKVHTYIGNPTNGSNHIVVDDVRLYNYVLSSDQITALKNWVP